jgi:hypothetical protein
MEISTLVRLSTSANGKNLFGLLQMVDRKLLSRYRCRRSISACHDFFTHAFFVNQILLGQH